MGPKIVVVPPSNVSFDVALSVAPKGFEIVTASARDATFPAAMKDAEYLVGIGYINMDDAFYRNAPRLKLVQLLSAGYEHCDLEAARRARVPIANNGGANAVGVSEHAIMLMLALYRRLPWVHQSMAAGRWRGNAAMAEDLHELYGKTLGVIGLGTIGKKTARLAKAFGMTVYYYDIARLSEDAEDAIGVKFRALPEILRNSDIITLHVPLTPLTSGMIGAAELAMMKPSAMLINTARGQVVDEAALAAALNGRKLAGAGLDVFENEPTRPDDAILKAENVILTPHIAGPVWDNWVARYRNGFDNVQRVARGEKPFWVVPELRD